MSDPTRDYTIVCLSEALSPITHMAGVAGNEALVAREPAATPLGVAWVPCLSGNAIRHRMVREPGMLALIGDYGLAGVLTLPQLNFLLHGGNLTEGGGREDTARIAEFQRTWPLGRLLGGSLPDQILAGSLQCWRGALACEENREYLARILPRDTLPDRLRPAESFVSGYLYTRGDGRKSAGGMLSEAARDAGGDAASNLMLFGGQAVMRGAAFVHGFTLCHASEVELGALVRSLTLWQSAGGTIGGQGARGHGRLGLSLVAPDFDPASAVTAYLDHTASARAEAVSWLHSAFGARAPRTRGTAKGRGAGPAPAPAPFGDPAEDA